MTKDPTEEVRKLVERYEGRVADARRGSTMTHVLAFLAGGCIGVAAMAMLKGGGR